MVPSPLEQTLIDAGAMLMPYGEATGVHLAAACGPIEIEYAAIRKGCGLFDNPSRAVLELTGPDRLDFLNRMLTQELRGLATGSVRRSFWLNRKGRIDSDIRLTHLSERTLLEVDILARERTLKGLDAYLISEDAAIADRTAATHVLELHGPKAWEVVRRASGGSCAQALNLGEAREVVVAGVPVVVSRDDVAGSMGLHMIMHSGGAVEVARGLISAGHDEACGLQVVGWHAFNLARLEAGTPLYLVDFGEQSLPAETGVFEDRVSLTKGCYLGQEVVARMHARKQRKQALAWVVFERVADGDAAYPPAPEAPAPLMNEAGEVIGTLSSVGYSPMRGFVPVALAQMKPEASEAGTCVVARAVDSQGRDVMVPGVVSVPERSQDT